MGSPHTPVEGWPKSGFCWPSSSSSASWQPRRDKDAKKGEIQSAKETAANLREERDRNAFRGKNEPIAKRETRRRVEERNPNAMGNPNTMGNPTAMVGQKKEETIIREASAMETRG